MKKYVKVSRNIRILILLPLNIFAQNGASANRWRTMIEGLTQMETDLHITFIQGYGSLNEYKKYGSRGTIDNISYSYSNYMLQSSLWMKRISTYLLMPLFKFLNAYIIRKKIKHISPDIIWLLPSKNVLELYLLAVSNKKQLNHKLMLELNEFNDIGLVHSTNKIQLRMVNRGSQMLLNEIIPKSDLLIIMTKHLLEHYSQFSTPGKATFLHLPMTVDMNRFNLKKEATERYLAYCGSSSFYKDGVDILIKSFVVISLKYPEIRLKIAAFMEADGDKMIALIRELQMQDKIEYVGELHRDEIPYFIKNAEILLLPRPDSRQAQGGFPTKLGEYLATGNPVCLTKVGEISDYLVDNESAFIADPGDIDSFITVIDRALSDPENAKRVGLNGRKVAETHFSMDVQSKRLYSFLKESIS